MSTEQITDTQSGQHTHHQHSGESTHSSHQHSSGHHHHSHSSKKRKHRIDSAEREKNKRLTAAKRRKLFARILFILLCVIAAVIALATIILYAIPDPEVPSLTQ